MLANFLRKHAGDVGLARVLFNWYAPFVGAAIRITESSKDYRYIRVEMPLTWYNANYVGVQFGGGIYMMTDPFFMLMYLRNLGNEYLVWDKAAHIEFIKPGRRRLIAEFRLSEDDLNRVRSETADGQKHLVDREVLIHDDEGTLIAKVVKTIYVRKKKS